MGREDRGEGDTKQGQRQAEHSHGHGNIELLHHTLDADSQRCYTESAAP